MRKIAVTFGLVLIAFVVWALVGFQTRISEVTVAPGGDCLVSADNPVDRGPAVVTTEDVVGLHLSGDGNAGGLRIQEVEQGLSTGDALSIGQPVGGPDLAGSYPMIVRQNPPLKASGVLNAVSLSAGDCDEVDVSVAGATPGMVAGVTLGAAATNGTSTVAWVKASGLVGVRTCAVASVVVGADGFEVGVVQ